MKNRDWERGLPPIAREKLARIGGLTPEEKEKMMVSEKVNSLLSEFYQGAIDPEGLWQRLKVEDKPSLLRETQLRLVDSLNFNSIPTELQMRRDGILAIETLKKEQNTSVVESNLNLVEDLQKRYKTEMEKTYNGIRVEVEKNPQLRVKQIQQGQNNVIIQLTVDDAIKQLPQWQDFLFRHEKKYRQEFAQVMEKLKKDLK